MLTTDGRTWRASSENWLSTGWAEGTTRGFASVTGSFASLAASTGPEITVPIRMPATSVGEHQRQRQQPLVLET